MSTILKVKVFLLRNTNWLADKQSDSKRDKFHHLTGKYQKRLHTMKDEW